MSEPILVSACLLGIRCRYDGSSRPCPPLIALYNEGNAIAICPESLSGLPIPRPPCEKCGDRFLNRNGEDVTRAFIQGALRALRHAQISGCKTAVLKANSPSCGVGRVYDGTFSGKLIPGNGIFAQLLLDAGFHVQNEKEFLANLTGSKIYDSVPCHILYKPVQLMEK